MGQARGWAAAQPVSGAFARLTQPVYGSPESLCRLAVHYSSLVLYPVDNAIRERGEIDSDMVRDTYGK